MEEVGGDKWGKLQSSLLGRGEEWQGTVGTARARGCDITVPRSYPKGAEGALSLGLMRSSWI